MREGTVLHGRPPRRAMPARRRVARTGLAVAALVLSACAGDASEPDSAPGESADTSATSASASAETESATVSPSPAASPTPDKPKKPRFRENPAGKRAFVRYIINGWGYALQTNDPSVLLKASGRKPCRGCDALRRELKQRDNENWYVKFPGARVRKVTFKADGPVEVATVVANIPQSQSLFEDNTVRNNNKARKGVRFLVDIRADGQGKKRHWTLVAFSVK